ncbi:hypothetical protein Ddye_013974 [Dipteronia dyeriana]|uniref:Ion transport domain-containing protein n=1 Tax=Dipteronia dyeriana TaxID=168575 RepID=A0AAE0CKQ3_9ROSI|nr:hypothetical protein Ddye_013974 [Dipteronia dyeriana]
MPVSEYRVMEDQSHAVSLEEIDLDSRADGEGSGCTVKYARILDPQGPFTNWIFLMLCVISISMDPLFFYVPVIKVDKNCLELDKNLGVIFCVFRSVIDLFYIICIRYQLRTNTSAQSLLLFGHSLHKSFIDLLAVLPLPQVIIIISKLNPSNFLEAMYVLKYFLFFQFVPRVIRIYPLFRKASTRIRAEVTWVKAAFNLYLYIISGHIFGALWYFFAIERKIECWMKACIGMNQTRCNRQSFNCKSSGNYRYLNRCSTKSHKTTFFDFGIYHDALQSGVVDGSYLQKFMYCFRWGLQSLSCFGQNLKTSTDIWENLFTILITISSVVLFIFLLGNMQLYLQSETTRSEDMKLKVREIERWKTFKKLTEDLQRQIQNYHQHLWRETKGVDVENLLNKFPRHLSRKIKCDLCLDRLKRNEKMQVFDTNNEVFDKRHRRPPYINATSGSDEEAWEWALGANRGVLQHFQDLFKKVECHSPRLRGLNFKRLLAEEKEGLETEFSRGQCVVGNKVSSPDGLTLSFIQANWEVIRDNFLRFISEFHKDNAIVKEIKKTFIALVPKCGKPKLMKDFRPISLVGCMYKVIGKGSSQPS